MQYFAFVFTCSPLAPCLSESFLKQTGIMANFTSIDKLRWLAPDIACEIIIKATPIEAKSLLMVMRKVLSKQPVDVNVVLANSKRKKLLVIADMDSTIIEQECIDELAEAAGVGSEIRTITEQAMQGELNFEHALVKRVRLLEGLSVTTVKHILKNRIRLMGGAVEFIQTMRQNGCYCALVSSGFTSFTSVISRLVGFDKHQANSLEVVNGKLTGRVLNPILNGEAKLAALNIMLKEQRIEVSQSLAVGDGANDLLMISHAGLGCAFRAKSILSRSADVIIQHCDLTGLLYLQGFSVDRFYSAHEHINSQV
ncbi:MAG: Phosphoserine phosphatase SerB2 [Hyphomicrobiaceae bacterium hypho_1]